MMLIVLYVLYGNVRIGYPAHIRVAIFFLACAKVGKISEAATANVTE
jgi:hypothetical protein